MPQIKNQISQQRRQLRRTCISQLLNGTVKIQESKHTNQVSALSNKLKMNRKVELLLMTIRGHVLAGWGEHTSTKTSV